MRRETAGVYLRAAGIAVRRPGTWGRGAPAKPANEVTTGSEAKPAIEVTTGSEPVAASLSTVVRSSCQPFRDFIELGLGQGRNAMAIWQDLVASHGFTGNYQAVKRYVRKLRGKQTPEARVVIQTAPGEDYGECRVMVRTGGARALCAATRASRDLPALHNAITTTQATR